jgi:hypothetical protein
MINQKVNKNKEAIPKRLITIIVAMVVITSLPYHSSSCRYIYTGRQHIRPGHFHKSNDGTDSS